MRIESMDAANQIEVPVDKVPQNSQQKINPHGSKQKEQKEQKEVLSLTGKTVASAIEKANKAIHYSNYELHFSVHEKTKEIVVKVIDSNTKEVIREIPPEKILDMVANILEMAGILVDERR